MKILTGSWRDWLKELIDLVVPGVHADRPTRKNPKGGKKR